MNPTADAPPPDTPDKTRILRRMHDQLSRHRGTGARPMAKKDMQAIIHSFVERRFGPVGERFPAPRFPAPRPVDKT